VRKTLITALVALAIGFLPTVAESKNSGGPEDRAFTVGSPATFLGTYVFDARSDAFGGDASGQFNIDISAFAKPAGPVTCLRVIGNTAIIGGTDETGHVFDVGTPVTFTVQDNGPAGTGDLVSQLLWNPAEACLPQTPTSPVTGGGDIVVEDAPCANPKDKPGTDKDRCKDKTP
jgi:hypothetical protein